MKSPYTGKEMVPVYEKRLWHFRGENYSYNRLSWYDEDTKESFTTDESDDASFIQVTNQYRDKYGIPYTDEIKAVRERYGLSAAKMSLLLGFGTNQYGKYENGDVPNPSNGRTIASAMNPLVMKDYLERTRHELSESDYAKISNKIEAIISDNIKHRIDSYAKSRIFSTARGPENGYAIQALDRLENLLLYVIENNESVWTTKMNKILFYIDFLAYKKFGMAISGLSYKAIDFGPVPEKWFRIYSEFDSIEQRPERAMEYGGTKLTSSQKPSMTMFSEEEKSVISHVCRLLSEKSSSQISAMSHREEAWLKHKDKQERIPFEEAFSIKEISLQ